MKIAITDFRGIQNLDAAINGILLLAGSNGAGKSSACSAIAAALTGQLTPFEGVTKAKAGLLVRDGGASASVTVTGPDGGASVVWPACERAEKGKAPWASTIAAGGTDPLRMDAKTRAAWLIDLIGALPDEPETKTALCEAGLSDAEADAVWKSIGARGWDAAHAEAKEQGAKYKGQWEKTTGARYGSAKAATWRPDGWRSGIEMFGLDELQRLAEDSAAQVEDVRKVSLQGEMKRRDAENAISAAQRALSERDSAKGHMLAAKNAVDAARTARDRLGPPADQLFSCPCCEAQLALIGNALIVAPEDAASPADIVKANLALKEAEQEHARKEAHYRRLLDEIAAGEKAEAALREMPVLPAPAALAEMKTASEEAVLHLRMKRQVIEATRLHEQISRQAEVVKLLAEDGLRQSALVAALGSFAGELHDITKAAAWRPVTIDADMSISYGGRPVSLCSAGEQFRVRCVLQIAAARRDGSALVILDGADILDRDGRNGLFRVLRGSQAVVGMTMRREDMPDLAKAGIGTSMWIEPSQERIAA